MNRKLLVMTLAGSLGISAGWAAGSEGQWTQFRGPGARGISASKGLPERWSATENVAWKTDLPGRGWSSPVVWGDRVFLTTVVNHGETEAPKKGLYFGGNRLDPPKSPHDWKVYCLDLKSGKVRWEKSVVSGLPKGPRHLKNSFASETPVTDGERVYALFGGVGLFCFDLNGKQLWSVPLEAMPTRFGWGTAASPVLHKDRIYVVNDNDQQSYLLSLDKKTGKQVWRVDRDEKSNWSTPFIWENKQRTEIVTLGSGQVRSYDLNGKQLWSLKGMSDITIATPYSADGLLYFSSGYVGSRLKPIYAVRPGAEGDISLPENERSNQFIAWCDWKIAPYNPSTLLYEGRLYVLYDRGLFSVFDSQTGQSKVDRERLGDASAFTSSPWAANGKVYCLSEDGVAYVIRAGDKFELLGTNKLADDDMCMATPALAGDRLLIRTSARLYCISTSR